MEDIERLRVHARYLRRIARNSLADALEALIDANERLIAKVDQLQLDLIECRNPGIDMELVKQTRSGH